MQASRRAFLQAAGVLGIGALTTSCETTGKSHRADQGTRRPNVVLIISDDQGYADLGCHGNPDVQTPNIDSLHAQSTRFTNFHVNPVCTPTRACLMTGRYNFRTGAIDTYRGRAMMAPDEITMAESFRASGYRTGIFGKWHLGDCYPMRAMDQGFEESVIHHGGGLGQPSDVPGSGYFNPVLSHNGVEQQYEGYCTDVFASATIEFIKANREVPFFAYVPTNAPHSPLLVDEKYVVPYRAKGLSETTSKLYGMITNLDENVGRILSAIDDAGLRDDTIVIFMTDNGPYRVDETRFTAGMRGEKGTVYQGGIRVPLFVRYPKRFQAGADCDALAAHIDLLPTLAELCDVKLPQSASLDGISLVPGLKRPLPSRTIFAQWHRGDAPELYNNCMARDERYKLVNGRELYDLINDPAESADIAGQHPDIVQRLRNDYERWFADVCSTRGFGTNRIYLGAPESPVVYLTQQDWRGVGSSKESEVGTWELEVLAEGPYKVTVRLPKRENPGKVHLGGAAAPAVVNSDAGQEVCYFDGVRFVPGPAGLRIWLESGEAEFGATHVYISKA